jgi:FkbM family methyltransferase
MLGYLSRLFGKRAEQPLSQFELKRLRRLPRYSPVETKVYDKKISVNDACTLIGDVRGILQKGVYNFSTRHSTPVIIDCGANIGMSVLYFKKLYPRAKVLAFEPDPELFALLSKNIASFGFDNVSLEQKAVWVDDMGVSFQLEGGHSGTIVETDNEGKNIVSVPSVRLKDVLDAFEYVDMLKVDIEGAENAVILDCGDVLGKCDHVFIEYHSRNSESQHLHSILGLFHEMGYRYHVQGAFTRNQPFVDTKCLVGMDLQLNLFFSK